MSNLIQQSQQNNGVVSSSFFSPEQVRLIKRTIMSESATDDDLALFGQVCSRLGLDPFAKQINAIERGWGDNKKWSFEVTIDGYRAIADATKQYGGSECYWCGNDGTWVDVWLKDELPAAAKCIVWRKDSDKPFIAVAKFKSYKGTKKDGSLNSIWQKFPDLMIAKCAESLALRKAFPRQLSGVYTQEEMNQANTLEATVIDEKDEKSDYIQSIKPLRETLGWSVNNFIDWLKSNFGVDHPKKLESLELKRVVSELQELVFQQTKDRNLETLENDVFTEENA